GAVAQGSGGAGNTGGGFMGTGGGFVGTGGAVSGTGGVLAGTGGGSVDATGGAPAATGGGGGVTPPACNEAEGQVCSSYKVGEHCGLTYEIWTDSSEACMTNTTTGFIAKWDQG